MANYYQSKYTGREIDSKLAQVKELEPNATSTETTPVELTTIKIDGKIYKIASQTAVLDYDILDGGKANG